jgi:site-specific DNA recombinase
MTCNWNNDQAYCRCRFPSEYALANRVDHPKTVYLGEADIINHLDTWLGQAFDPGNLDATLTQPRQAAVGNDHTSAWSEAVRARIAVLDQKTAQYRASLDAGGDPAVIGPWMAETQAQRVVAQAEIRSSAGQRRMTPGDIAAIVAALGDLVGIIRDADPADKADLYTQLGLTMTYRP